LYDPQWHAGTAERGVRIYHGSSWRLAVAVEGTTQVFGQAASIGQLPNGESIVEFVVTDTPQSGCDYWAIAGQGLSQAEIVALAESARPV
jgi:hypothetical protein